MTDKLGAFTFHGLALTIKGGQAVGDCPFCGKENHFFVNAETGQWDCKICSDRGNVHHFLQNLYDQMLSTTSDRNYKSLSSQRDQLAPQAFKDAKVAWDHRQERWLIPITNGRDDALLANLCTWEPTDGMRNPPALQLHLITPFGIQKDGPIFVCEGFWDACAFNYFLSHRVKTSDSFSVVAAPSAGTFKDKWVEYFKGREVIFLYDNDNSGSEGQRRAKLLVAKQAKTVGWIEWTSAYDDKYDIHNFVTDNAKAPKKAWDALQAMIKVEGKGTPNKPKLKRENFQQVLKDFKKVIHMNRYQEDVLATLFAITFSIRIPGDPLWGFLVGPPGSGKTLLINCFMGAPDHTVYLSKMTASSLVSGFAGCDDDPSILAQLRGKTLLIKDYTAIMAMPLSVQEELYGILRDAYDGTVRIVFGNGQVREYNNLHFSSIAGVTDAIHNHNRAALGERFLKIELLEDTHNSDKHTRSALDRSAGIAEHEELLKASVAAFLETDMDPEKLPVIPPDWIDWIVALAQIGSYLRAVVIRDGVDLASRPRPEVGTRLAKQLKKLIQALTFVYGLKKPDDNVKRVVQKVLFDTVLGWNSEIVSHLLDRAEGLTISELMVKMQVSQSLLQKKLTDMQELGIVECYNLTTSQAGRPSMMWMVSIEIRDLFRRAGIDPLKIAKKKRRPSRKAPSNKK